MLLHGTVEDPRHVVHTCSAFVIFFKMRYITTKIRADTDLVKNIID